jgi:MFS family permease
LNVLNFVDRQLLQSFIVDVRRDLNLSYFEFSLLTGVAFSVFYTVAGLFMGALADRTNRARLIAVGVFVWSALTAATGFVRSFWEMALARSFIAVGESTLTPSATSMLADVFDNRRHGLVMSVYYLGIPIGAGGSLLIAGLLGPAIGWRGCFIALGILGVTLALLCLLLRDPRDKRQAAASPSAQANIGARGLARTLRETPSLALVLLGAVLLIFPQGALMLDQAWLVQERGYAVEEAQTKFGALFLAAGIVGSLASGWISDAMFQRSPAGRLWFLVICFGLATPISIAFRLVPPDTPMFYAMAAFGSMIIMAPYGPIIATVQDLSPPQARATAVALTVLLMSLLGTALGSLAAGALGDWLTQERIAQPLTATLIVCSSVGALGAGVIAIAAAKIAHRSNG